MSFGAGEAGRQFFKNTIWNRSFGNTLGLRNESVSQRKAVAHQSRKGSFWFRNRQCRSPFEKLKKHYQNLQKSRDFLMIILNPILTVPTILLKTTKKNVIVPIHGPFSGVSKIDQMPLITSKSVFLRSQIWSRGGGSPLLESQNIQKLTTFFLIVPAEGRLSERPVA